MDSIEATLVTLSLVLLLRKQPKRAQRKRRQYWMHPFNKERLLGGHYVTTFKILKNYEHKFRSCYRMTFSTFCELLSIVEPELTRRNTVMRQCISAEERLIITLRYLATGCNFTDLHLDFKCGHTTARRIVKETVEVIWKKLKDISMPEPTEESHLKTAKVFMKHADFPNSIGAIDGKHIRIIKPCHTGSEYYNYKHFFSIVLLAICDAHYNFIDIDVGCYGKSADSTIHDSSKWVKKIRQGNLFIYLFTTIHLSLQGILMR